MRKKEKWLTDIIESLFFFFASQLRMIGREVYGSSHPEKPWGTSYDYRSEMLLKFSSLKYISKFWDFGIPLFVSNVKFWEAENLG